MLKPLITAIRAAIVFIGHMAVCAVIAGCFRLFEICWSYIYGVHEPMLVDRVPLRYVLEIGDLAVIGAFLVYGFVEAVQVFRRERYRRREGHSDESRS